MNQARDRAATWGSQDTLAVWTALEQYLQLSASRWPYTYSADYVRIHLLDYPASRSEAAQYVTQLAEKLDLSREFLCCLFAAIYLGSTSDGLLIMSAIADSPTIRELFEIAYKVVSKEVLHGSS